MSVDSTLTFPTDGKVATRVKERIKDLAYIREGGDMEMIFNGVDGGGPRLPR